MDHAAHLAELAAAYRAADEARERARLALAEGMRGASAAGARQGEILEATGHVWTREYVRRVLKGDVVTVEKAQELA